MLYKIKMRCILIVWICMFSFFAFPKVSCAKFFQTFLYRCGGAVFNAGDEVIMAKFDLIIGLERFRYDNIHGNTWAAIKEINPKTKYTIINGQKFTMKLADFILLMKPIGGS